MNKIIREVCDIHTVGLQKREERERIRKTFKEIII